MADSFDEILKEVPPGVSLQTHAMVKGAGNDICITSAIDKESKEHHGIIYGRHDSLGGTERWMILISDDKGFKTHKEACEKFREKLPEIYQYIETMEEDGQ